MAAAKKTTAAKKPEAATATDVAVSDPALEPVHPAGVPEALTGPTSSDLNPAFS